MNGSQPVRVSRWERAEARNSMNEYVSAAFKDMIFPGHSEQEHRERLFHPFDAPTAFTARPVKQNEFRGQTDAMEAYWNEWTNLQERNVWRWGTLCEWERKLILDSLFEL